MAEMPVGREVVFAVANLGRQIEPVGPRAGPGLDLLGGEREVGGVL